MNTDTSASRQERSTWMDVMVFAATFLLGIGAYVTLKIWLGERAQLPISIALVTLMVLYAVVVAWVPRLRIRLDQAGDNAYYLGLLFTLASMAFALYDFRIATQGAANVTGVQRIISNFGIALATTIAGIFLRVSLHQMRIDPADLEAVTRIELSEAAARLRTTLDTLTVDLSRFHLEMQQRSLDVSAELSQRVVDSLAQLNLRTTETSERFTVSAAEALREMLARTADLTTALTATAQDALAAGQRLRAVEPPPLVFARRLDKVAAVLEHVATHSERTRDAVHAIGESVVEATGAVHAMAESLEKRAARIETEHLNSAAHLSKATASIETAAVPLGESLSLAVVRAKELLAELKQANDELGHSHKAAAQVLTDLAHITQQMTMVMRSVPGRPHASA